MAYDPQSTLSPVADKINDVLIQYTKECSEILRQDKFYRNDEYKIASYPLLNFYTELGREVAHNTRCYEATSMIEHRSYIHETSDEIVNLRRAEFMRLFVMGNRKQLATALSAYRSDLIIYAVRFDNSEGFRMKEKERIYFMELNLVVAGLTQ